METENSSRWRLNPFSFPPETHVRFTLLILAALSTTVLPSQILYPESLFATIADLPGTEIPVDEYYDRAQVIYLEQIGKAVRILAIQVGIVLTMFALAGILYRLYPSYIRRTKKLRPLARTQYSAFQDEVRRLADHASVSPPPAIEVAGSLRSLNAQAFGSRNRYVLRLDNGLRLLWRKRADEFQARVLHELGHIVNGDVERTYFTQSLWFAVLLATLGPLVVYSIYGAVRRGVPRLVKEGLAGINWARPLFWFQAGAMIVLIGAIRAGLLRIREIYADWRAATLGAEQSLSTILGNSALREKTPPKVKVWRLHPTAQERLTMLQNPTRLFRVSPDLPFFVGYLLAFVSVAMVDVSVSIALGMGAGALALGVYLADLATVHSKRFLIVPAMLVMLSMPLAVVLSVLLPLFVGGYMISGIIGLQVQREAVAEMALGRRGRTRFLRLVQISGLIALGLEVGFLIMPIGIFSPLTLYSAELVSKPMSMMASILVWLLGVIGLVWLSLFYARFFGRRVLGTHVGQSPPKWKRRLLTLASSAWLCVALMGLLALRLMISVPDEGLSADIMRTLKDFALISLVGALCLYVAAFSGTWVVTYIGRLVRHPRCPTCKQMIHSKVTVGAKCTHCAGLLAPWLTVRSASPDLDEAELASHLS